MVDRRTLFGAPLQSTALSWSGPRRESGGSLRDLRREYAHSIKLTVNGQTRASDWTECASPAFVPMKKYPDIRTSQHHVKARQ